MNQQAKPGLHAIESASRDEISALQLERLKWSVRHTYDNVAPYRAKCEAQGVHPDDLKTLSDLSKFPFTFSTLDPARPKRNLKVRISTAERM